MMKMPIIIDGIQYGYYCVGRDVSVAYETISNLLEIMGYSLIIGILVSLLLGYLIAGRSIKPIKEAYMVKQRFVANASHELRTPLSIIMLSSETLEREMANSSGFLQQTVGDIKDEAINMKGLVENLLFLARNDASSLNIEKEQLDIGEMLHKNISSYRNFSDEKDIIINSQIEDNLKLLGDRKLLNSMISVLLDNAIKYTPPGGSLTITGIYSKGRRNNHIEIRVEDTGVGISKEDLSHIFERFYRVESSRSKHTGGYGLGLSIVKEIIDYHHGSIAVTSEIDKGSCFVVSLPVE
jgi:signal transduction histidine kinase